MIPNDDRKLKLIYLIIGKFGSKSANDIPRKTTFLWLSK